MSIIVSVVDCAIQTPAASSFNQLIHLFPELRFLYHSPPHYGISDLLNTKSHAYIIFGSHSNVEDQLNWQIQLADFLYQKLTKDKIPVLALCFGHQLMAHRFGGIIAKNENNKTHKGARKITIINDCKFLTKGMAYDFCVSHSFEVKSLPSNFIHLGSSSQCQYEIIAHQNLPLISTQGHPEADDFFFEREVGAFPEDKKQQAKKSGQDFIKLFIQAVQSGSFNL